MQATLKIKPRTPYPKMQELNTLWTRPNIKCNHSLS